MKAKSLRIGRLAGIPIHVDLSWLLIFAGMSWFLAKAYFPSAWAGEVATYWALAIGTTLLFFATVLFHELGHAVIARRRGAQVRRVTLLLFGGVAEVDFEPQRPRDELAAALAGPAVTLAMGLLLGALYALTRPHAAILAASARLLAIGNLGLGLFNLLPGLPLDGGRLLRAILWALQGNLAWATLQAARVGQGIAVVIMSAGVLVAVRQNLDAGILAALVGFSLHSSARAVVQHAAIQGALQGFVVADLMQDHSAMLDPALTLDRLPIELLMGDSAGYLVGNQERVVGLVRLRQLRRVPRSRWEHTPLADTIVPWGEIEPLPPEMPLDRALQRMAASDMAQLPVMADGALHGILSRQRIVAFVEMRREAGLGK